MSGPEILTSGPADRTTIEALDRSVREATGHRALGEAVWRDLDHAAPTSIGYLAREGTHAVGYLHVARSDTFTPQHWSLGLVRAPGDPRSVASNRLLDAAQDHIAANGGGQTILWQFDPTPADDALFASRQFEPKRDLYEMRVALPLTEVARFPDDVVVRTFEPGRDEAAWLEVNNRAFVNHPEQGGWIEATLVRRMSEPWFDPERFLLVFDGDGLAGFNWLKVHEPDGHDPRLGEIFVIGVDPGHQGRGFGRALAVEGLALLAKDGITTGLLFVAAENTGALALYRALGFEVHRVDRAYERMVTPT